MARPYVTVHFAQSLDGHIDRPAARHNLTISNEAGFLAAHRARASHDGVLVGITTVLRDDPRLLVSRLPGRHPDRVVLDSALRLPTTARLLDETPGARVIVFGCRERAAAGSVEALQERGAIVVLLDAGVDGRIPIIPALEALHGLGLKRLLVEGGAQVIKTFFRSHAVDNLQVEVAPRVIGSGGLSGLASVPGGFELENVALEPLGSHILICGTPSYRT